MALSDFFPVFYRYPACRDALACNGPVSQYKKRWSGRVLSVRRLMAGVALTLLGGCGTSIQEIHQQPYLQHAPAGTAEVAGSAPALDGFISLFADLSKENVAERLDQVYAPTLYFDDTFHTFSDRDALRRYFLALADNAQTEVQVLDYMQQGQDYWVRWQMRTRYQILWKQLDISTVGMTHLRFNEQGYVILHQDYWDGIRGFYQYIPLVGGALQSIRQRLGGANG